MLTNLKNLCDQIREGKFWFEVCLTDKQGMFGKKTIAEAEALTGSLEHYFEKVGKANATQELGVQLFAKNGSSFLRKGFFLLQLPAVVDKGATVVDASTTAQASKPVQIVSASQPPVIQGIAPPAVKLKPMENLKTEIENATLKTENRYLTEKVDEQKNRIKELEKRCDEYYNENLKLNRDNTVQKDKLELEYQQKLFDVTTKQKAGLSGIMEDIKTMPPEAWQFIAGLVPNHPMAKALHVAPAREGDLSGMSKHSDPDAQALLEHVNEYLAEKPAEIVGTLAMVLEYLGNHPESLAALYKQFYPDTK